MELVFAVVFGKYSVVVPEHVDEDVNDLCMLSIKQFPKLKKVFNFT